jgi:hypothetical protein
LTQAATPVPCHQLRIGAERADADHRIARIEVDVGHRGEVDGHPGVGEAGADRPVDLLGRSRVVQVPEGGRARGRAAPHGVETGDVAALLVEGDQQVTSRGRPQPVGELTDAGAVTDVAAEEDDAAEAVRERVQQPGRRLGAAVAEQ